MANWEKLIEEHYEKKNKINVDDVYRLIDEALARETNYQGSGAIEGHPHKRLSTKGTKKPGGEPYDEDPPKARSKSAPAGFGVLEEDMLEESTLNWSELNTYDWRLKKFYELLASDEPVSWEMVDGTKVLIPREKNEDLVAELEAIVKKGEQLPGLIKVTTADGKVINTNKLKKTSDFGGGKMNQGDVAEGILGAAIYARFMNPDKDITAEDIRAVLDKVASSPSKDDNPKKSVTWITGNSPEDKITLTVALAPSNFDALISTDPVAMKKLLPLYKSSATYVNKEQIVDDAMKLEMNGRPNIIDVISDGVSDQKGTKVDVKVEVDGKPVRLGNISLKTISNTMGQTGKSWDQATIDKKTGEVVKRTGIVPFFEKSFGVGVNQNLKGGYETAISAYMSLPKGAKSNTTSEQSNKVKEEVWKVYENVVNQISNRSFIKQDGEDDALVSDKEAPFVRNVVKGIKNAVTLGDDSVKLLSFGGGDYKLLDLSTLDEAFETVNLQVTMGEGNTPRILIKDENSGLEFIQIRMKLESKPMVRHYFEKKDGLNKIFAIASEKAKEDSQEEK